MLQIVLLAGKFIFLIILYLFVYRVVRSSTRELRLAAPSAAKQPWSGATPPHTGQVVAGAGALASASGVWTMVVEKSPSLTTGAAYSFPPGTHALVGRSSDMGIFLDDTFVSSKHALFETTPEGLVVEDLRSTNGTQVNGVDITESMVLDPGDRVEVGDTVFRVEVR
jgi:hypothetical protein